MADYDKFVKLGLSDNCTKKSTIFIKKNHGYQDKERFLDNLFKDNFAVMNKGLDGYCNFLDRDTRLCGVYENRPQVCKDFSNNSLHCKKIMRCIE